MNQEETIARYINRKHVGDFLRAVSHEYLLNEDTSIKRMSGTVFKYNLVNEKQEKIDIAFSFYKTAWKVDIESDCYESEGLGYFKNVKESFNIGSKLKTFLDNHKFSKVKIIKNIDTLPVMDIIYGIKKATKELIESNFKCTVSIFDDKKELVAIMKMFESFTPDTSSMNLLNLFSLFQHMEKVQASEFVKELALYEIAKAIINVKYDMLSDNPSDKSFEIEAKSNQICYAHVLQYYGGKCKDLHGHNGSLVIKANMINDTLAKRPMLLSYGFLKAFLKHVDNLLDHKTFWALNEENQMIKVPDGWAIETPRIKITFKTLDGLTILPKLKNSISYSTSEVTLLNFVIPQFLIYLVRFFIKDSGPDSTNMAFCDMSEPIRFSFKWFETDSTVCTITIDC